MTSPHVPPRCTRLRYSRHALERMFQRGISPDVLEAALDSGEVIATYADDQPYPSVLLLGWHKAQPIHAVVAQDPVTGLCQVVTVYRPQANLWDTTFKVRKST